jgi:hypothetical protein
LQCLGPNSVAFDSPQSPKAYPYHLRPTAAILSSVQLPGVHLSPIEITILLNLL